MSLSVLNTCWNLSLHTQTSETDNPTKKPQNKIEVGQWVLVLLDSEYNLQTEEKKSVAFLNLFCGGSLLLDSVTLVLVRVSKLQEAGPSEEDIAHRAEHSF